MPLQWIADTHNKKYSFWKNFLLRERKETNQLNQKLCSTSTGALALTHHLWPLDMVFVDLLNAVDIPTKSHLIICGEDINTLLGGRTNDVDCSNTSFENNFLNVPQKSQFFPVMLSHACAISEFSLSSSSFLLARFFDLVTQKFDSGT